MQLPDGAITMEQWKPDPLKIVSIIAELLGRQEGRVCEVVNRDGSPVCAEENRMTVKSKYRRTAV